MQFDPNESINDLDHVYKRGAYSPQPAPMNGGSGGMGKPTTFPRHQPTGPKSQPETPESKAAGVMVGRANKSAQNYKQHGGNIVKAAMALPATPGPSGPNKTDYSGDMGVIGPESYSTSQHSVMLNRAGQIDEGGYASSKYRHERAQRTGNGMDAARQEFEGYTPGSEVQLHGSSAAGKVITSTPIEGNRRISSSQERAMMPGLIESGVNVPHRTSQGLSANKATAEQQIAHMRSFQPYNPSGPGGVTPRFADLEHLSPDQYRKLDTPSNITPPGVVIDLAPNRRK